MSTTTTSAPLECLEALVGLRGACPATDPAAAYLDEVGVTERELADFLTSQYATTADLFKSLRTLALRELTLRVDQHLRPRYKPGSLLEEGRVGYFKPDRPYQNTTPGTLGGFHLLLDAPASYLALQVATVTLQVEDDGDVDVVAYDLQQGVELYRVTVPAKAGELVTAPVHWVFPARRHRRSILIARDLGGPRGVLTDTTTARGCTSCNGRASAHLLPELTARAATADPVDLTDGGLTYPAASAGLSLVLSVACDHEGWLCGFSRTLILPALYQTAAQVYSHALRAAAGERLNARLGDPERLRQLRDEFQQLAEVSLGRVLSNIAPPKDERCYFCDVRTRSVIALP